MEFDARGSDFIEADFFVPQSFLSMEREQWHCELSVVPGTRLTLFVSSESGIGGAWHTVTHDYGDCIDCSNCNAFKYCKPEKYVNDHPWCKHCQRASLVLALRNSRRAKRSTQLPVLAVSTASTLQAPGSWVNKMDRAALTKNKPFSILR